MAKRRSPALVKAEKQLASARMRARKLAQKYNKPPLEKIATQIGGGALSGVARVYSPIQDVAGIDIDAIAGVSLVAYGSFAKGRASDMAVDLGTGMLCAVASRYTQSYFQK